MRNFVIPSKETVDPENLSNYLKDSIESFSELTSIAVTYYGNDDTVVREFGVNRKPCKWLSAFSDENSPCRKSLASAGHLTYRLGEPYIFLCQSGFINIAVSLIYKSDVFGYFIAGPISMGDLRKQSLQRFRELNHVENMKDEECRSIFSCLPKYQPKQISQLALLFYNTILSSLPESSHYQTLRNAAGIESEVGESIRIMKNSGQDMSYPYELENTLLFDLKTGKQDKVDEDIEKILHTFSIMEVGDVDRVRGRILWMLAVILRAFAERSNELNINDGDNLDMINMLNDTDNLEELSAATREVIRHISTSMSSSVYTGRSEIVSDAIGYIQDNYMNKIRLDDMCRGLHVDKSYFSFLFKKEVGISFTDYLSQLRVGKACHLLTGGEMPIAQIARTVGFEDQSYFTRVFKKYKEVTPYVYRRDN